MDKKRILFLFSDTGGGHRSATEAIIEAIEEKYPARFNLSMLDVFKEYAPRPLNAAPAMYPGMVHYPRVWELGYRISDSPLRAGAIQRVTWPYVRAAINRMVAEQPADLIVSVHPVFNAPVIRAMGENHPPFITVVTDLVSVHALWYERRVDLCILPTEAAMARALDCGLRPHQLKLVGLPVSKRFCQPLGEKSDLRTALEWPLDLPMVLLVGGGEGMGPLYETAREIAALGGQFGLAIVAGRNESLRARLSAVNWQIPTFVYGFERRMPEMMQAADLLVTKAGPGTVMEAINAGLPLVLYSRLPGQEDGNVDYVVEEGIGVWAPGASNTARAVQRWLQNPAAMARATETCRQLARPQAAFEIAEILAGWLPG